MPPQGMPHPTEAEYAAFTSWLAGSLDRAWVGRSTSGPLRRASPEPHRVRQRDSRSAGARHRRDRAAAERRRELRLRQHRGVAEDVAAPARAVSRPRRSASARMAVGDPDVRARDGRVFDQPRIQPERSTSTACRSGHAAAPWSATCFRPTASTSCPGGWSGESRKATPASRATTCRTRSSSRSTARRCIPRRSAASRTTKSRPGT